MTEPPSRHPRRFDEPARGTPFSNPWAECWGGESGGASPHPVQMQPEPTRMRHAQMEAVVAEAEPCEDAGETGGPRPDGVLVRVLPIINNKGLHARASAKFVQTVEQFNADVKVSRCGETVGGLSIMGLMMLAAARGTSITVEASGKEAAPCMAAIEALLANRFGEDA